MMQASLRDGVFAMGYYTNGKQPAMRHVLVKRRINARHLRQFRMTCRISAGHL
jgi:hypothetical protein